MITIKDIEREHKKEYGKNYREEMKYRKEASELRNKYEQKLFTDLSEEKHHKVLDRIFCNK